MIEKKPKFLSVALAMILTQVVGIAAVIIDYRLSVINGSITLTIRDYCARFDPMLYLEENHSNPEKVIGIAIVKNLAKEVRYFNAFNSNNIIIAIH